jgi:hypothetical protein
MCQYLGQVKNLTYVSRPCNQPKHLSLRIKKIFGQHIIIDHTTPFMKFDPLTFGWRQTSLLSSHLTCCDNMLHYILFIKYFILNITKNIKFEISYLIEICSNDMIRVFKKKFNNVHNYIYFLLKI